MGKKFKGMLLFLLLTIMPIVNAEEVDEYTIVSREEKYFMITTTLSNSSLMSMSGQGALASFTTEITEEEYNAAPELPEVTIMGNTAVEVSYQRLSATIAKLGSQQYEYEAISTWKSIPSVRSYDIMGIGYYASVTPAATHDFEQYYCTTSNFCNTLYSHYIYQGNNGTGAMFNLPSGSLKTLRQTLTVQVKKTNPNSTIIAQRNTSAYAHASRTISYNNAKDFTVGLTGIDLGNNAYSYYNSNIYTTATWTGTW